MATKRVLSAVRTLFLFSIVFFLNIQTLICCPRYDSSSPLPHLALSADHVVIAETYEQYCVGSSNLTVMKVEKVIKGTCRPTHIICFTPDERRYGRFHDQVGYRWLMCLEDRAKCYAYYRSQLASEYRCAAYTRICGYGGARRRIYEHNGQEVIIRDHTEAMDLEYRSRSFDELTSFQTVTKATEEILRFSHMAEADVAVLILELTLELDKKEKLRNYQFREYIRRMAPYIYYGDESILENIGKLREIRRTFIDWHLGDLCPRENTHTKISDALARKETDKARKLLLSYIERNKDKDFRDHNEMLKKLAKTLSEHSQFRLAHLALDEHFRFLLNSPRPYRGVNKHIDEKSDAYFLRGQIYETESKVEAARFSYIQCLDSINEIRGGLQTHIRAFLRLASLGNCFQPKEYVRDGLGVLDSVFFLQFGLRYGARQLLTELPCLAAELSPEEGMMLFDLGLELLRRKGLKNSVAYPDYLNLYADFLSQDKCAKFIPRGWFGIKNTGYLPFLRKIADCGRKNLPPRKAYEKCDHESLALRVSQRIRALKPSFPNNTNPPRWHVSLPDGYRWSGPR